MKTQARKTALAALLLAGAWMAVPAPAQEPAAAEIARLRNDVTRLKREAQRAEAEARRTDSLAREEQTAASRGQERALRDRERREKENAALTARVRDARARISTERTRGQGYANGIEEIKAREKALLAYLAGVGDSLIARIEAGMPWDNETRRDRVLALKRDVEAGTAVPDEALSRLSAVLKEEIKSGDEIALLTRPLTRRNGEVINAQILKLGNQAAFYVDDEGKKFGILEARAENGKTAWTWREELDFGTRNIVKKALAVKAGREAPRLAELPLALTGLRQEGNR